MPNFMVLRNAAAIRTVSPLERSGPATREITPPGPPEPQVEVHDLSTPEAASIARDPEVAAVAIPMPTVLVKPTDCDAATGAAANSAWGIPAVKADTSGFTGDGVVVAVLDTGIDNTH